MLSFRQGWNGAKNDTGVADLGLELNDDKDPSGLYYSSFHNIKGNDLVGIKLFQPQSRSAG